MRFWRYGLARASLSLALLTAGCSAHLQTPTLCFHGTLLDVRVGGWECTGTEYAGEAGQDPMSEQARELAGDLTEMLAGLAKLYASLQGLSALGGFPASPPAAPEIVE